MNDGNISSLENGLYISVDWLSFTVKNDMNIASILSMFGLDMKDFQTGLNGRYGYKSMIRHLVHPISLLFDGNDGMGIHVEVTGSAVGYFIQCYRNKNTSVVIPFNTTAYMTDSFDNTVLSDLLKDILDIGQITRFDLAIDDLGSHYYTMDELTDIFDSGLYVSKFRKWKLTKEQEKNNTTGHTIYLGSRQSEIVFRIYDKKLEQISKKKVSSTSSPWVRWEMELHKNRACAVAMLLIAGSSLSDLAIGVLANYLRLIKRDNVRDSRCSNTEKWDSFINGIRKVTLCQPIPEKTLQEKKDWLRKQVAPTLSAVYQIDESLDFIYELISNGSIRQSKELMNIIRKAMEDFDYDT